ncbi:MAG: S8 family serine peptidase [Ilumatobacter sp.]|nr:S8 family serine peptidase [Ilumatobacter sp.]
MNVERNYLGRSGRLAALVVAVSMAVAFGTADAGKGGNGGGGGGGGPTSCADLGGTTLDDVRAGVGADTALATDGLTGAGIGIAVIDTGVNPTPGLDAPGKIIDGPDLSFDALDENLRHRDVHGHGTNMAAIIAADGAPYGGDGVAPGAHIVNLKVGAGDGAVDVSQVIAAIDWAVANRNVNGANIRVISLAYGTDATQSHAVDPLSHAVENAWRHGIVVVAAGGNDGRSIRRLANPAHNPYVLAVGAAERKSSGWQVPSWSSTGDGVRNPDLVAPGADVVSAAVPGSYLASTHPDATCVAPDGSIMLRGSGTSQAAAAAAGAVALLLEQRPSLTPDQVKYLLTRNTRNTNSQNDTQEGWGRLSLYEANKKHNGAAEAATPGIEAVQVHGTSSGLGSLEAARGTHHVGDENDQLTGEVTAYGETWAPLTWAPASSAGTAWSGQIYIDGTWNGGTWAGASWSGASWSGASWSGASWSGASWSGASWSGASWSGASWSGASWSGASWSGASWSGASWS